MAQITDEQIDETAVEQNETPASPVEVTEGTTETPAPEVEVDLTAFVQAAEAAIESSDFTEVNAEYNKLDRKGKGAATKFVNGEVKRMLTVDKDRDGAFAWGQLGVALKTVKSESTKTPREPKAPVNRTETVVDQLAALYVAYTTASTNVDPTGLDEDWKEKLQGRIEELGPEVAKLLEYRKLVVPEGEEPTPAPEVSEAASRAVRLAFQGGTKKAVSNPRTGEVYSGPRRSIAKHIAEAFAAHPSGTFLPVSAIRSFESSEYGSDLPSAGAISAAMKSAKWDASEFVPGLGGEKNTFGATKK